VIASSNGALVTAKLSAAAEPGIDISVLLPAAPAPAPSSAAPDSQATGKKRNKQQQQQQQQQDGHVSIAAIEPCSVAVTWSGCAVAAAAIYDCSFGSCRYTAQKNNWNAVITMTSTLQGPHRPFIHRH
jgi:hypothetical protein